MYEKLNVIIKQLNSIQRAQIVRSLIPKKIVFSNLSKSLREQIEMETGQISFRVFNPITGQELSASNHTFLMPNSILKASFSTMIDIERFNLKNPANRVSLGSNLNLVEFKIFFQKQVKKQKYILYFRHPRAVKKSDLFYCFIKMRSDVCFKLYFVPQFFRPEEGGKDPKEFELSKVQVNVGSENNRSKPLVSNGSFISAIRRAKNSVHESNYRYNILIAPSPKENSDTSNALARFPRLQKAQGKLLPAHDHQGQVPDPRKEQHLYEISKPEPDPPIIHSSLFQTQHSPDFSAKLRPLAESGAHEVPFSLEEQAFERRKQQPTLLISGDACFQTGFVEEVERPRSTRGEEFSGKYFLNKYAQHISQWPTILRRNEIDRVNKNSISEEPIKHHKREFKATGIAVDKNPRGAEKSLKIQNVMTENQQESSSEKSRFEKECASRAAINHAESGQPSPTQGNQPLDASCVFENHDLQDSEFSPLIRYTRPTK